MILRESWKNPRSLKQKPKKELNGKMLEYIDLKYKPKKEELVAEYYLEPNNISIEEACEQIAAESSIGTWTDISTMKEEIAKKLKPHVFSIDRERGIAKIAYSCELFESGNIPQIMSAIAGNILGMKIINNLRLLDIEFPKSIINSFKGPKFGIDGIRKLLKVKKRPLIGTIIKPKVGLNEEEHAKVAYDAWTGSLDIVKDDENLTNMSFNRFEKRVIETVKMKEKAERETGEKKIYMPNITAETNEMIRRMKFVKDQGNEYAMVDIISTGFSGLQTVRNINEDLNLVIHAHRAGHAALTRNARHGISMLVIAKIARLIGVDQMHIGTASVGKMEETSREAEDIEQEIESSFITRKGHVLEQKWFNIKPVFAVASGGLHPGSIPNVVKVMGNNIVMQFGGGCNGHPDGTKAGAMAIRQALEATMKNISLDKYAENHPELKAALGKWG
jgi:ribulose-bisphosphate carboxylase large chain